MATKKRSGRAGFAVASLAATQHGVISRGQLRDLGLSDGAIARRLASGLLHPVLHGVFAVGHDAIGRHGRMRAAVLACGEGAVISHGSAAELAGLWDRESALVSVIAPNWAGRKIDGVRRHFVSPPETAEVTARDRIPCTNVSRTIVDLAGSVGDRSLRRLIEQAAVLGALDVAGVDSILSHGRRRGARRLRMALAPWRGEAGRSPLLRSTMEARMLAAIGAADLPRPRCNAELWIDGHRLEVDLIWEQAQLVIETDGERTHGTSAAFRRDRWRDQLLAVAGYRVLRVTWGQLEDEPAAVVDRIRRMLVSS